MGKKILMLFVCTMLSASMAWAQTRTVTGTVVDSETGEPIPGAQVKVQGTSLGAVADSKGAFVLKNLPKDAKNVIVSFMGMKTADVALRDGMKVILIPDTKAMDEVMVVAYGTQTKSSFTGSAAILDSKEIGKMQITNAFDALKGKAAGVQIFNATGQPGSTPNIRIRGFNSMIASQAPLIVLDGSPYDGSWNDINPADVESMTVLKDAASTALYGARGGNGVIIITTKTGKRHKDAEINFEAKWGANMKGNRDYDVISDPRGYYETYYKGLYSYAKNQRGMTSDGAWKWANANMIDRTNGYGLGYQVYNVPEGEAFIGTNGKVNPNATLGNVVTGKDGNKY
jgi:TonB-dependent SusC/RagA subfamily outer membrane receptor